MLQELSVDDLKQSLQKKENMVATLTEYLEQAALKLNELQKTAGGNAPRAFDSEMVHHQMELVSHLQEPSRNGKSLKPRPRWSGSARSWRSCGERSWTVWPRRLAGGCRMLSLPAPPIRPRLGLPRKS